VGLRQGLHAVGPLSSFKCLHQTSIAASMLSSSNLFVGFIELVFSLKILKNSQKKLFDKVFILF
jgi:hypothetical protein